MRRGDQEKLRTTVATLHDLKKTCKRTLVRQVPIINHPEDARGLKRASALSEELEREALIDSTTLVKGWVEEDQVIYAMLLWWNPIAPQRTIAILHTEPILGPALMDALNRLSVLVNKAQMSARESFCHGESEHATSAAEV